MILTQFSPPFNPVLTNVFCFSLGVRTLSVNFIQLLNSFIKPEAGRWGRVVGGEGEGGRVVGGEGEGGRVVGGEGEGGRVVGGEGEGQ